MSEVPPLEIRVHKENLMLCQIFRQLFKLFLDFSMNLLVFSPQNYVSREIYQVIHLRNIYLKIAGSELLEMDK